MSSFEATIAHCSLTDIANDPRILRQVTAQEAEGYRVVALDKSDALPVRFMTPMEKLRRAALQLPAWVFPQSLIVRGQLMGPVNKALFQGLETRKPQLIHVHNPELLPAVMKYAQQAGLPWVYDSHEYGPEERLESLPWRLTFPAFVRALEQQCAPHASDVTCVSSTLAGYLQDDWGLATRPCVMRNVPDSQPFKPRPTNPHAILLHYHGLMNSGRGIERLLDVLSHLSPRFRLRLTGPVAQPGYDAAILDYGRSLGLEDRFILHGAVPNAQLIAHAHEADIGLFLYEAHTKQLQCALPNKLFDYAQAGLMVVAGTGLEVRSSLDANGNGLAIGDLDPVNIAAQFGNTNARGY